MQATPQQEAAITTQGRSLLVEAGAGTGKTWVLVRRFLHLLEQHPAWPLESIIAITFTEKAAREMRSRIRHAVEDRANEQPEDDVWQQRLRHLDRLQVSTIHGLCAQILRANAIAAGLDPRFEVLDEQESRLLKEEAITRTLARLVDEGSPALRLLQGLQIRDLREELTTLLGKRGTIHRLFKQAIDPPALLAQWRVEYRTMQQAEWRRLCHKSPELPEALESLPSIEISAPEDKLAPMVRAAQAGCCHLEEGNWEKAFECVDSINLQGGSQKNWGGKAQLRELKDHLKAVRDTLRSFAKKGYTTPPGAGDEQAVEALQQWRTLWQALSESYDQLKQAQNALDFDDLEILTERLLRQQPRAGRLATLLGEIRHLMVDEFQDTNEAQRRIVYELAPPKSGRLFIVGDAKQSIYRFRQAQVTVFNETATKIEKITGEPPLKLNRSFRTQSELLGSLNDLFNRLLQPEEAQHEQFEARPGPLVSAREPAPPHPAAPAPVELLLLPKRDGDGESINAERARIWEARHLGERLLALKEAAFPVWDKATGTYRPFQLHDAAILFRATTSMYLYEEQFNKLGIPYLAVSGRGYYERPEVQDLIALLSALHNPLDDLNLAIALRSPLFQLSDESLYRLRWHTADGTRHDSPIPFRRALEAPPPTDQSEEVTFAATLLPELWEIAGRVTVWQLLRVALDRTGYEVALALHGGTGARRQIRNVHKLLAMAGEWDSTTLSGFLRRVQDLRASEAREGEALAGEPEQGSVQLMSIHAAKGLEFPVVALADLGRARQSPSSTPRVLCDPAFGLLCKQRDDNDDWQKPASYLWGEWMDRRMEAAENKRLLYVACTRAADLLLLSGKLGSEDSWLNDLLAAWEIESSGEKERLLERDGYRIRLLCPDDPPDDSDRARRRPAGAGTPGLETVPPLAAPLPHVAAVPNTVLDRRSAGVDGGNGLRPAVHRLPGGAANNLPWDLAGRTIERVLGNWTLFDTPPGRLRSQLATVAREEGITDGAVAGVVEEALAALRRLKASPLFDAIDRAPARYCRLPFTLRGSGRPLHGVIDLLYQDSEGGWHLVQWNGKWCEGEQVATEVEQAKAPVAISRQAARSAIQVDPTVSLCFLTPKMVIHQYSEKELATVWERVASEAG